MKKVKIKDIAILACWPEDEKAPPIGEACPYEDSCIGIGARVAMEKRLFFGINKLMDKAHEIHLKNYQLLKKNPNYITRISTNEFFFYTQSPLTVEEFQNLMNKIFLKLSKFQAGIHIVLGSFAVKNCNNQVINVTPYIIGDGIRSSFAFVAKSNISSLDPCFKEKDETLQNLGVKNKISQMPQIIINNISYPITFYNLIVCTTPGGTPIITALEICLDHSFKLASVNIQNMLEENLLIKQYSISHLIISNSINSNAKNCLGTVMHVDPDLSVHKYNTKKLGVEIGEEFFFGKNESKIYELDTMPLETLKSIMESNTKLNKAPPKPTIINQKKDTLESKKFPSFFRHKERSKKPCLKKTNHITSRPYRDPLESAAKKVKKT